MRRPVAPQARFANLPKSVVRSNIIPKMNLRTAMQFSLASKEYKNNAVNWVRGARPTMALAPMRRLVDAFASKIAMALVHGIARLRKQRVSASAVKHFDFGGGLSAQVRVRSSRPMTPSMAKVIFYKEEYTQAVAWQELTITTRAGAYMVQRDGAFMVNTWPAYAAAPISKSGVALMKSVMTRALKIYKAHPVSTWS